MLPGLRGSLAPLRHKRLASQGLGKQAGKLRGLSAPAATHFKSDDDKAVKDLTVSPFFGAASRN